MQVRDLILGCYGGLALPIKKLLAMVPQGAQDIANDDTRFGNIELCRLNEIRCAI